MKKRSITIGLIVLLLAAMLVGCGATESEYPITENRAKEIAIEQLGVPSDVTSYALVTKEGTAEEPYYVVEVLLEGVVYKYSIDVQNGDIKKLTVNDQKVDPTQKPLLPSDPDANYIGIERAKEIAFADAGITAEQAQKVDFEMDFAYGRYLYDIEFRANGHRYEYEIPAQSGEIFLKNVDQVTVTEPTVDGTAFIGVAKAKEIALSKANATEEDAVLEKAKWELEKGSPVYEVEFTHAGVSHEYVIHAVSGEVIGYEADGKKESTSDKIDTSENHITVKQAKQIALNHAGIHKTEVVFKETELDFVRGIEVYEIEFRVGNVEYEYEINAKTGEVVKAEQDMDD